MSKLLKGCLLLVVLLVALPLAALYVFVPSEYEVSRSLVVRATPAEIHPWVAELRKWPEWTVWAERDPETVHEYSGAASGVGQVQTWASEDPSVGHGRVEITASDPASGVRTRIVFGEPGDEMPPAEGYVRYEPEGASTRVTFGLRGDVGNSPAARVFAWLMDDLAGPDFEGNLENLRARVEGDG